MFKTGGGLLLEVCSEERGRVEVFRILFFPKKRERKRKRQGNKNLGSGEFKWVNDEGRVWANSEEMPVECKDLQFVDFTYIIVICQKKHWANSGRVQPCLFLWLCFPNIQREMSH